VDRREVVFVAVLLLALALVAGAACAATLPFEEGFESFANGAYPSADGWTPLMTGKPAYVAQGVYYSGSKSFRQDSYPWAGRMDCVILDSVPDRVSYEASVCADAKNGWIALVGFMKVYGKTPALWNYFGVDGKTGRVTFYGAAATDLGPHVRGQWYKVRADLDYKALTADLWVNDMMVAEHVAITPKQFTNGNMGPVTLNQFGVSSPASFAFSNIVYFDDLKVWEPIIIIPVEIDVKPGEDPAPINLKANGVLPVAVFSSDTFDATQIDPATALLSGAPVAVRGGRNAKWMAHVEDVDGDGLLDLLLQFENRQLDPEQLQDGLALLTGATYGGDQIAGQDEIVLVGRNASNRLIR